MTFKPRVGRLPWVFTDHPIYFVSARTLDHQRILAEARVHETFRAFALRAEDYRVLVGFYMLMPDHLHLFAALAPEAPSLSMWMKSLRNTLSKALKGTGVAAPHWQDGFFDHVLRSEESYEEKRRYVRENPVRAGLVRRAEEWPYQGEIHRLEMRGRL